jgi:hypothetical protein
MDLSKVKTGQWIAGIGGLLLFISMFIDWYGAKVSVGGLTVTGGGGSAFDSPGFLGGVADLLIIIAAGIGVGAFLIAAFGRQVELPMAENQLTMTAGVVAAVLIFLRMLFQPGPNEFVTLKFGIFFALLMAIAVAVGGWMGLREEGASLGGMTGGGAQPPSQGQPPAPGPPPPGGPPA